MKTNLNIALLQIEPHWHEPESNRAYLEEKISEIEEPVDIIMLPEMFTTGFITKNVAAYAEPPNLHTFKWLKQMAIMHQAAITGSYLIKEQGKIYNRLYWLQPDGVMYCYDKHFLFFEEANEITAGSKLPLLIQYKGWKICPFICFELRFPIWCHTHKCDLMLFVANWHQDRITAWDTLLRARAIEQQCFVAGVNIVGNNFYKQPAYNGHSAVIDFLGRELAFLENKEAILMAHLDYKAMQTLRNSFFV